MANAFESEIAESAKRLGLYYKKWPVAQRGPIKLAANDYDGFLVAGGRHIALEMKSTKEFGAFPLDRVPPHQEEGLRRVIAEGGKAWLLLNFRKTDGKTDNRTFAVDFRHWGKIVETMTHLRRKSVSGPIIEGHLTWFLPLPRIRHEGALVWDLRMLI